MAIDLTCFSAMFQGGANVSKTSGCPAQAWLDKVSAASPNVYHCYLLGTLW